MTPTVRKRNQLAGAAVALVALLAVVQGAKASRTSAFMVRSLLQDGSCSASSPCPDSSNCCSQYGYCGTGDTYCGTGCKNGPCYGGTPPSGGGGGGSGSGWSSFFTQSDFESWFPNRNQGFYTYDAFTAATSAYPAFGTSGSSQDDQKREIAAFFANVNQETGGLQYIEEIDKSGNYCDATNTQYPCAAGKLYYGRGALQISWNYNYGPAGEALGLDLLGNPDQVAQDPKVAFDTGLWFWMTRGCHDAIVGSPPNFGQTIQIINGGIECGQGSNQAMQNRINAYKSFCSTLGVDPGSNLSC